MQNLSVPPFIAAMILAEQIDRATSLDKRRGLTRAESKARTLAVRQENIDSGKYSTPDDERDMALLNDALEKSYGPEIILTVPTKEQRDVIWTLITLPDGQFDISSTPKFRDEFFAAFPTLTEFGRRGIVGEPTGAFNGLIATHISSMFGFDTEWPDSVMEAAKTDTLAMEKYMKQDLHRILEKL